MEAVIVLLILLWVLLFVLFYYRTLEVRNEKRFNHYICRKYDMLMAEGKENEDG